MTIYVRGSKTVVEREEQIKDWEILLHADTLEEAVSFVLLSLEDKPKKDEPIPEHSFWSWKHIELLDENLNQLHYYFNHEWLPENSIFRLRPAYEKIAQYVTVPPQPEKKADLEAYRASFEKSVGIAAVG